MENLTIEILADPEVGGFTARIPDIPAYGEGTTEELAISDLKESLRAYIEAFGIEDAMSRVNPPSVLRHLEVSLREFSLA